MKKSIKFNLTESIAVTALWELQNSIVAEAQKRAEQATARFNAEVGELLKEKNIKDLPKNARPIFDKNNRVTSVEWDEPDEQDQPKSKR